MSIVLLSTEGERFPITNQMAELSATLEQMSYATSASEETGGEVAIPLAFKKKAVRKLVKWMELYLANQQQSSSAVQPPTNAVTNWQRRFFQSLSHKRLMSLLNLANFLHVSALLETGSTFISEKLANKTIEEARFYLGQKSDFSATEEREINEKFGWLLDKF